MGLSSVIVTTNDFNVVIRHGNSSFWAACETFEDGRYGRLTPFVSVFPIQGGPLPEQLTNPFG